jgi:hypothetical protein
MSQQKDEKTGSKIYQATASAPVNIAVPLPFIYLDALTCPGHQILGEKIYQAESSVKLVNFRHSLAEGSMCVDNGIVLFLL